MATKGAEILDACDRVSFKCPETKRKNVIKKGVIGSPLFLNPSERAQETTWLYAFSVCRRHNGPQEFFPKYPPTIRQVIIFLFFPPSFLMYTLSFNLGDEPIDHPERLK